MKSVKRSSAQSSVAVLSTRRQKRPPSTSERSYTVDQATDAKAAMIETLREMRETLKMAADVRSCAKHHPWIVTGLAAAVGFAAGVVLTPSPRNRARADLQSEPRQTRSSRGTMMAKRAFATLAGIAAGTVKNIALSSITAAIASQHATPTEPATHRDSDAAEPHCGEGLEL